MFLLSVRTSTWLTAAVFVAVAIIRRDRKALLAGWVWLAGFEAAYQATNIAIGHPLPAWRWGPFLLIALGVAAVLQARRYGVRPTWPLLAIVTVVWIVWVATGYHSNHPPGPINITAEVLNEAAKTLWALAYLLPFWLTTRSRQRRVLRQPSSSLIADDG